MISVRNSLRLLDCTVDKAWVAPPQTLPTEKEALTKARAVLEANCSELYAWQSKLGHLSFEHICPARAKPSSA
jgi:hypothetical protein